MKTENTELESALFKELEGMKRETAELKRESEAFKREKAELASALDRANVVLAKEQNAGREEVEEARREADRRWEARLSAAKKEVGAR